MCEPVLKCYQKQIIKIRGNMHFAFGGASINPFSKIKDHRRAAQNTLETHAPDPQLPLFHDILKMFGVYVDIFPININNRNNCVSKGSFRSRTNLQTNVSK